MHDPQETRKEFSRRALIKGGAIAAVTSLGGASDATAPKAPPDSPFVSRANITLEVNGVSHRVAVEPRSTLLSMFCENASTSPAPRRVAIAENAALVRFILTDVESMGAWCLRSLPMERKSRRSKDWLKVISFTPCSKLLSIMMLFSAGTAHPDRSCLR